MLTILALAAAAAPAPPLRLAWPLACRPGQSCFIQNYFDRDPGPGVRDYACGPMSYQGHDGVDIRVPSLAEMRAGVAVLAAAPGKVVGIRDGVADISIRAPGAPSVKGQECGNGVAIDHGGGWRTQYCHMKRGSVRVKTGMSVTAGQALGQIGLSGDTEFPHLHLSVFRAGAKVDPFAYGAAAGTCGQGSSLWKADLRAALAYRSPSVIARGFASGPVTAAAVDEGRAGLPAPTSTSPALVAFVRAIGLRKGDVQRLRLVSPKGDVPVDSSEPALDRDKAQYMLFAGKKAPPGGFAKGGWRAHYSVSRGGRLVVDHTWTITL